MLADKKKLMAKFAKHQSIIEDRRRTSNELINNALLGCHNSNNERLKSSASSISTTAGSTTPASSSRGLLMPTQHRCCVIDRVQNTIAPLMLMTKKKAEMSQGRRNGAPRNITTVLLRCASAFSLLSPYIVANPSQSHLNDDSTD